MAYNLKGRNFLTLKDFSKEEIEYLLTLAEDLKSKKRAGIKGNNLEGKNIALIFEKPSTRTRCAFVVAARDEGGKPEYLGKNDIQLGKKESVADTARVLGRFFDGIEFRGFEHQTVEILGEYAGVPVWNGLTDLYHPTQILADFLTLKENFDKLKGLKLVYAGDGRNNMANSLMIGSAIMGVNFTVVAPKELWPEQGLLQECKELAEKSGAEINVTAEIESGVKNADAIYTDVWVSMGEEDKFENRIELLKPYQVNMEMIKYAENPNLIFLHCLPAYHNTETENGKKIYEQYSLKEMEVTEEVFESKYSKVFDQAENRMHTIKAVMTATI
ncbi:ornithine carbamoyltransferase [Halanaerobium congolense]|jgi:ornithine carbamoyltransferase|uniref:Ornithine carbamoyltransferase n=2 Tax=Halanaerobium congolense TaxID=54121 RepID=A0A1G6KC49_9FIRM|nr:ornithine carbamoyltransferase [Halanaerobium congolense]KXS50031.1 MAG: ornithine carbamoyltransferase [Halanaerobium sp. T82-1]OEG63481.1 MAG: ornithine carbamoyltransferase [Halanaerobium sp. MDAL1]PUU91988.1 MAG: ornithine carbamoyltransferase [Halanaerobium sp.]PTX17661.1 ornithine carbamoyltransferase [Halanaerobium congolense]TDP20724.1 ornithine carbamoyltransferase [Halanaerobium congolense]